MIVLWCNGSTADFGSVSLGSNPGRTTNIINNMWIEKVDNERYKIKINTSLGEQTKIVHRS